MRKYHLNEDYFKNIDTEGKAYWLGFICADGCVSSTNKKTKSLRLSFNIQERDKSMLIKLRDALESNYPIKHRTMNKGKPKLESKQVYIQINSNKLCDDLIALGVTQAKTNTLEIPEIEHHLMRHFIRGFYDGDGSLSYSKRKDWNGYRFSFEIVGKSYDIIRDMHKHMVDEGIDVRIYTRKSNNTYRLMTGSLDTIIKIERFLYHDANIYMERKFLKANEVINIAV